MQSVTAEAPANDAPTPEVDQSYDELRPASDFAQDVQTVPQPETPAGPTPATITVDQPLIALNAAAPAADSSDLDDQLRSKNEDAIQSIAATDGTGAEHVGKQVGPSGRFVPDVYATVSEGEAGPIAPLHAVKPSLEAHSPAARTKGAGSEGEGAAATSAESLSATTVDAQVFEPASTGSSVVQQISEAVQTWRDALQEQGTARFSAWLTPPDMGHVWVELTRSAEGITARLSASDDDVQSLLATQEPELRQALADSGITVNELDVSGRSTGDSASQQQQPPPERPEDSESPAARLIQPPHRRPAPTRSSAVDVRA
jgi:flagellar hook-length control protein FliK